jgi:acyl transferase domain-containing protein
MTLVLSEQSRARKEADDSQRPHDLSTLIDTAIDTLQQRNNESSWSVPNVFFDSNTNQSKIAFLFPGQASQYPNMGRDLACIFPEFRNALAAANDPAITDAIYPVPTQNDARRAEYAARLAQTQIAQPALGAISLAMLRVLERFNVAADFCAGHSFGELVALRAAGSIDDNAMHTLAATRGQLMATGDGDRGTMLAVTAPIDDLQRSIADAGIDVVLANRNAPNQGILSGATAAIDLAERHCAARGWRTTRLAVSAAFHSRFMADAAGKFREAMDGVAFNPPRVPVYSNNTAQPVPHDAEQYPRPARRPTHPAGRFRPRDHQPLRRRREALCRGRTQVRAYFAGRRDPCRSRA